MSGLLSGMVGSISDQAASKVSRGPQTLGRAGPLRTWCKGGTEAVFLAMKIVAPLSQE
jgi:hypothetical protein